MLLICAILSPMQLSEYAGIARELGLSALVEAHDEKEVEMALAAGARIVGVNNRNLKDLRWISIIPCGCGNWCRRTSSSYLRAV